MMKKTTLIIAALFVVGHIGLVAPFVPVANILPAGFGALSMSSMALTLILAARWRIVDRIMGGPDKSYVAHRWLGFFALAGALIHWALASSVGAGMLPVLTESGEDVGNIAAVGLLVMTVAAMVRAIPYHLWKASHMLMGPIFLIAAYHTFFVASPLAIGAAPWVLMAIVSIIGLLAWVRTLWRKSAPTRLVRVEHLRPFFGGVDVTFCADKPLPAFRAGQFTTLSYNKARAETHPFTIAGGDEYARRFVIRAAGDWTQEFVHSVRLGDEFRLGRGVGRFLPQLKRKRSEQLWVAGGVGITPFLAALEQMQPDSGALVTLVYCIRSRDSAGGLDDIQRHVARLPQLNLVLFVKGETTPLDKSQLGRIMRNMDKKTQVYLCGPDGLKNLVTEVWELIGMKGRIHSEQFDFRGAYTVDELIYVGRPMIESLQHVLANKKEKVYASFGA